MGESGAGPGLDVDAVARSALRELAVFPGVRRVGIALTEGGGRRLRFLASDADDSGGSTWCHIDAYDDVPLAVVVRTGEPVLGDLDELSDRFAGVVARQRAEGTRALAALPLPGRYAPLGGVVLFFDERPQWAHSLRRRLEEVARRTAEAVRRARAGSTSDALEAAGTPDLATLLLDEDPRAPSRARHFLRDLLDAWQIGEVSDVAQLCLSELVTNAVVHAASRSVLTVAHVDGTLTVTVRDRGAQQLDPDLFDDLDDEEKSLQVFGRGLMLVDALADRWGTERDEQGTTSWFAIDVAARSTAVS